ncbi:alpha-2-macroglobulin family protein [Pseudopelagicola sp. nBUS_19]|uniref:alpha-2-macroglobulin family protein n=1 Tax=Pseudopelagicola sp. nBUS_19 TaxID=3395316 RepID=UPI003EBE3C45
MRWFICALTSLFFVQSTDAQQSYVPDRRIVISRDVDFYGADLQNLFDTTYEACVQACLTDNACAAFTFNSRSNACFPKRAVIETAPYEGATSGEVYVTASSVKILAERRAGDLNFISGAELSRAADLALDIGRIHAGGPWDIETMLANARAREVDGNFVSAMRWIGGAVGKSDLGDLWLEYGRLNNLSVGANGSETRKYKDRAYLASLNAYLRAPNDPARVSALSQLADFLEESRRGRIAVSALRLAVSIQPRDDIVRKLESSIAKYGFRISEHKVDSDSEQPRICVEFNEALVKSGFDYAPFVKLPDQRLAIQASDRQICVEGVVHGQRYTITFREGLPSQSGEKLTWDIDLTAYVRDRSPNVTFSGRAYVLPRTKDAGLPIETTNLNEVDLILQRVSDRNLLRAVQESYFGKPLSYWQFEDFSRDVAETVWKGTGAVRNELNQTMITRLPIGEAIADQPPGVYALTADLPGAEPYDETSTTQWFVLSNLGVTSLSGVDGLHVFVRGLSDAKAREGVTVSLLSRANRVLGTVETGAQGYALFEAGLIRGTEGAAPALLLMEKGDDFSFLSLTDPAFDLSDRGVEGRPPAPPVDLFVSTDRGAYRAGETIYATALVRGDVSQALPGLPLTAILTRPDGMEYARHISSSDVAGGHVFAMPIGSTVPRGSWKIEFKSDLDDAPLATAKVLVEDFLPERIDFDLSLAEAPLDIFDPAPLTVDAQYLFGAPGADLAVEGKLTLRLRDDVEGFEGYHFGRYDERVSSRTKYFSGDTTGVDGIALVTLPIPDISADGRPLKADIAVQVMEGSGRPVERQLSHPVAPLGPMIGIKPTFAEGVVAEGTAAKFKIVALGPDLQHQPMKLRWTVNRVRTTYQWYQLYGSWEWEPTTTRSYVAGGELVMAGQTNEVSVPVEWGRYEIVLEQVGGDFIASSTDFYAGWYAPVDASETPDTLELSLDQPGYRSGDIATLRVVPRFSGTALVTVMSNRLVAMKAVELSEGENLIPLEVTDEWGAGAYVTASIIRPMNEPAGQNPSRALGLSYASIDPGAKQLSLALDAPDKILPNTMLDVNIQVDGIAVGETAFVTLAAVDVGILNLTGFQSPDPSDHYFGQRRLGMEIRDIYGRLINGMNGAMGVIRSGGDATSSTHFDSPSPTEELLAHFTGPVQVDENGQAKVIFDLPQFNGTVRLMAIAWTATSVGQADQDVLVRNPVVVTASLPRFLAPGDSSRLLLEVVHAEGPAGRIGLDILAEGVVLDAGVVPSGMTLAEKATQRLTIPIAAQDVGDHSLHVAVTTPDGKQLIKTLTLPVRANDPEISTTQRIGLTAGEAMTLDTNLFANMRPGTGSAVISSGALARLDAPGLLQTLDRYPYGCTEQVTSRALPLLYFDRVSSALGLASRANVRDRIDQSIERILTRQANNGAFGLWRAESGDFWLDAYVSDFLSRARAKGYNVPNLAFRQAMDNLRNRINYAPDFDRGGEDVAYALMVLAREGAAAMGDLRYYADVKAEAFGSPLAAAQLGTALAYYGDQTRADRMFRQAASQIGRRWSEAPSQFWRADYGTRLRDAAGVLALAVESDSMAVDRADLAQRISTPGRTLSTQESVWSLMAAHALIEDDTMNNLSINGISIEGPLLRAFESDMLSTPLKISNDGTTPTDVTLTAIGVPNYLVEKGGYGYSIDRQYFTTDGDGMDPEDVRSGDRFVVVLTVKPFESGGARLMINDPLPAGFEIDNPSLLSSGDVRELEWLDPARAEHSEFRSDRFLAAVDWRSNSAFQLAYIVRAVSPGIYHHPAAVVEDMYRPQYRARTSATQLVVKE